MSNDLVKIRRRLSDTSVPVPELPLSISRYLVTNAELITVLNSLNLRNTEDGTYAIFNPYNPDIPLSQVDGIYRVRSGFEEHPVVGITWKGAQKIAEKLGGRLPTVSEWEKAAGEYTYPWGETDPSPRLANYGENVGRTSPVGIYPASVHGIHDLAGNVGEWCAYDASDALSADEFPVKGGGWNKPIESLKNSSVRYKWKRIGTVGIGFRVVFPHTRSGR